MEIACGVGLAFAPSLGMALYSQLGYAGPFIGIGAMFLFVSIFIKMLIPPKMDEKKTDILDDLNTDENDVPLAQSVQSESGLRETYQQQISEYDTQSDDSKKPSIPRLLLKPAVFFGCFTGALGFLTYSHQEPLLALNIKNYSFFNDSAFNRAMFFALNPVAYLIGGIGTQYQPRHVDLRVFIIFGLVINIAAMLCNGPSHYLGLPNDHRIMIVGQILSGISLSQLNVLALPEMLRQANLAFPQYEEEINNMCSGLFNSALGMGQISGPLLGG